MDTVIIRIVDLPYRVKGMTVKDDEGDYNVYLNARYSPDEQAIAFRHEVEHIKRGHFYQDRPVLDMENEIE